MRIQTKAKCVECGRVFDLSDEDDASEWYYGHGNSRGDAKRISTRFEHSAHAQRGSFLCYAVEYLTDRGRHVSVRHTDSGTYADACSTCTALLAAGWECASVVVVVAR